MIRKSLNYKLKQIRKKLSGDDYESGVGKKLSKERQGEDRINESDERYRLLSDLAFEGIGIHKEGVVIDVNRAFISMFGYSREELMGVNALGMIISERFQPIVLNNITQEFLEPYTVVGKRKNGTEFPLEIEARNFNYLGQRLRVTAFRDLSNKIRLNESLRSALKLNQLQSVASSEVVIATALDEAINITQSCAGFYCSFNANNKNSEFEGWKKDTNKNNILTITDFKSIIKNNTWEKKLRNGQFVLENNLWNTVDSKGLVNKYNSIAAIPVIENSVVKAVLGVYKNIGEYDETDKQLLSLLGENLCLILNNKRVEEALKESEKKFSLIAQNINDVFWICDIYGKFSYFSPSAIKWLEYTQNEINNLSIIDILLPDVQEQTRQQLIKRYEDEKMGTKTDDLDIIIPIVTKSGKIVPSEIKASPLHDAAGNYTGLVGVTRDVTLRVATEKNLLESEKQLKETLAAKDKFLSIIAHDLKSPFSALVGLTEVLNDKQETMNAESRAEIIRSIHTSSVRTFNLLENLLAWTSIHTGRKTVEPVPFIIEDLIICNIELFNTTLERKKIDVYFDRKAKNYVFADREMVNTIIRNLLSNALKYTFSGGHIEINTKIFDKNKILVSIKDSGIGIANKNIGKLFKIDSNFSTPGLENEKGTGLGLILCKEFIEKNNGQIWVESQQGKGAEFSFTLPVKS